MPENQSLVIKGEKQTITFVGSQAFTSWNSASTLQIGDATEEFEGIDPYKLMIENLGKKISNISQTDFQAIHNVCFINFEDGSSTLAPSTGIISVK
jgi:hypothetical protein